MTRTGRVATPSLEDAVVLHERGDLERAAAAYRAVLEADQTSHHALHGLGVVMFQRGHSDLALSLIEQAITLSPEVADYHYHAAEALRDAGRGAEAVPRYREAIRLRSGESDYYFGLGNACVEAERWAEAAEAFRRAAELSPRDAEVRNNLGNALASIGDREGAVEQLRRAVSLDDGYADARHNLAVALKESRRVSEALDEARHAHRLVPDRAEPLVNLGRLLDACGDTAGALACYRQASGLAGNDTALLAAIARGMREAGRAGEALPLLERALESEPRSAELRVDAARCLMETNRFADAEAHARTALEIDPDCAPALGALASCLQASGDFAASIDLLHRALALQPDMGEAAYMLAATGDYAVTDAELAHWQALAARTDLSDDQRTHIEFAVAKTLERRGAYEPAFRHFRTANGIKARRFPFDPTRHSAYVERLMIVFDPEHFRSREGFGIGDDRMVFIVGMPRSGSTLVEQVLASHSQVVAAGEHAGMLEIVRELPSATGNGQSFPECLAGLTRELSEELSQWYLDGLPDTTVNAGRVTDKMLGNHLRLGLIALLLPRARIVHCVRDPVDTCFSCFTQDFAHGLRFTTDMDHLVSFYRDYRKLMDHWRRVLPLPILDLQYEALVQDPEKSIRELLEFCGLPWQEDCLRPHRAAGSLATASVWQARQPIYQSSIRRWKHYESFIGPLIEGLAPYRPEARGPGD